MLVIFPFSASQISVNRSVFHVKKTFDLPEKYSRSSNIQFGSQNAAIIVPRHVSVNCFVAVLSRSSKISTDFCTRFSYSSSAFQKNSQFLKKTSNFSKYPSIAVRLVKCLDYQGGCLRSCGNAAVLGPLGADKGPECGRIETVG
jgi:hypothetical protein